MEFTAVRAARAFFEGLSSRKFNIDPARKISSVIS